MDALRTLDVYSATPPHQSEMLQFLNEGFKVPISGVPIAARLFEDIFARLSMDELPKTKDNVTLVFLGSGYAALEMYVALRFLDMSREVFGVQYRRPRVVLCDYLYGNPGESPEESLRKIANQAGISLELVASLADLPRHLGTGANRTNTLFFAFNFNRDPQSVVGFQEHGLLGPCWFYDATSVADTRRGEERGGKRIYRSVSTVEALWKPPQLRARTYVE